jgi:plasmid replication initiation protein
MIKKSTLNRKKIKEEEARCGGEIIVQHNKLIEARYRISLQEKRVVLWLLSQIKPTDNDFTLHRISIKDFCTIVGVSSNNMYAELQKVTKKLIGRVLTIRDPSKSLTLQVAWLSVAAYWEKEGVIDLKIASELRPYLLELKKEFTIIKLPDLMGLSSIYAIRIYEILKQYEICGERTITVEELRLACGIELNKYKLYGHFKDKILEISKREINEKTDLLINYEEVKTSRKITSINFKIRHNPNYGITEFEKMQREKADIIRKEMRSKNALIERIMEYGFSRPTAKRFLEQGTEEEIGNALKSVDLQISRGHVKNGKAMLKKAIEEKWKPDVYKTPKRA